MPSERRMSLKRMGSSRDMRSEAFEVPAYKACARSSVQSMPISPRCSSISALSESMTGFELEELLIATFLCIKLKIILKSGHPHST
eukprot:CAMPEP_0178441734 /NCGR_PEP_ID=MMETSP0689_2-20121128/37672_1 /TAXON_ID=160604 /ORGANISM="Amphidinium massartii, Strain CS-259" /LENGTH=85 /DNA_ID=CAMNT_0020064999 /DNA_START=38 /DNA_END=295 /DNA_ORIENTATION=+